MDSPVTYGSGWTNHGKFGKALTFDNTDDKVEVPHSANQLLTGGFTLSAWINPRSSGENNFGRIIDKGSDTSTTNGYSLLMANNNVQVVINAGTARNSASNSVPFGNWSHVVGVVAADGTVTLYVNGIQSGTPGTSGALSGITSTNPLTIGNRANATDRTFDGLIDEVKLYNYPLSADEVKVEYNQGKAIVLGSLSTNPDGTTASNSATRAYCPPGDTATCNPPVARWTFDENGDTTANDISGNANTGALINGPQWTEGKLGQALEFDGVDDYVNIADNAGFDTEDFLTISLWFKTANAGRPGRMLSHDDSDFKYIIDITSSDVLRFGTTHAVGGQQFTNNISIVPYEDSAWHHLVAVYDRTATSHLKLYVDTALFSSAVGVDEAIQDGDEGIHIGNWDTKYFKGTLDVSTIKRSSRQFFSRPCDIIDLL